MNAHTTATALSAQVAALIARARAAQAAVAGYDQTRTDLLCAAAAWAIMEPSRNRALAELAVRDTGLGNVADKIQKNHRKTLGLLRDLQHAKSVGVLSESTETGITEIARPVGVVGAITPSTNPGATPANMIINAMKGRNAIILAPSPKGYSTAALLVEFVHAQFDKLGAPRDLVQLLPAPVNKAITNELLQQVDLIVATGSQSNIRAAYSSGKPAFGVGAGNVSVIVHSSVDVGAAAERIVRSKTFDNATSCSSENSLVIEDAVFDAMITALTAHGCVRLGGADKATLQSAMFPGGHLSAAFTAKSATVIAALAGLNVAETTRVLMVEETGVGAEFPFSGEKLSPVLTIYRVANFEQAVAKVAQIYAHQGAGHSVGLHAANDQVETLARSLGETLPVARVIVNQAHAIATGGSFDNGLPFSLSMGCGTWGGNSFSDNLTYKNFLNITRIARPIPMRMADEIALFSPLFGAVGR
ncbi:MAG: aldehyde dehydrogenase family protein [Betaproteobacteria bacterium]|nr:MAG: aldehyde dehydrogenase family protein [Betaproteobacteria bacterium]